MMKLYYCLLVVTIFTLFSGCSYRSSQPAPVEKTTSATHDFPAIKDRLYAQYQEWKGVRYRIGGLDKSGIDCSGFAYVTFRSKLGIILPRTTEQQGRSGIPIKRSDLKAGDLVFFKTGRTVRHVGIYLENRKFLHASTSKGVIISSMDNVYWKSRYWKAKRIR